MCVCSHKWLLIPKLFFEPSSGSLNCPNETKMSDFSNSRCYGCSLRSLAAVLLFYSFLLILTDTQLITNQTCAFFSPCFKKLNNQCFWTKTLISACRLEPGVEGVDHDFQLHPERSPVEYLWILFFLFSPIAQGRTLRPLLALKEAHHCDWFN